MNRLSQSTSPYLLQHAHNPVDWYPWDEEALAKAKAEDKPIFLSIGYAACHWCHVMAHESFEDRETAALMNEHFINIKVDREERPDLDGIYMQAVTAMTGSGGWPMSVFLTPELKPFYAGTYFPPVSRYNMPSFKDVINSIVSAWQEERDQVFRVGGQVTERLQSATLASQSGTGITHEALKAAANSMLESYDWGYGGWGAAPKFPQAMALEFLLSHAVTHKEQREEYIKLVKHCLHAMARGGMYDIVGGGFSRYSTDNFWRVPHFEKMLYDNALLIRAYLHAWQVTREPAFQRVVIESLAFVTRELTHSDGGFYSSLDADSEGEEGKFYVWTQDEIRKVLKDDSDFFEAAYGITARGNWGGKIVLQRALDDSSLAARFKLVPSTASGQPPETVPDKLTECHARLLSARASRVRPGTDDKVLTAWNGLMLAAFVEAARVLDDTERTMSYLNVATRSAESLLSSLQPDGKLRRSWHDGQVTKEVFLEDYAALILGLLELYQTDFNNRWFISAQELADEMIQRFSDPAGGFFDTPNDGESLLVRPKDIQDNATPSGNALACEALFKLAAFTDKGDYWNLAEKALGLVGESVIRYPTAFARWLSVAEFALENGKQIAVLGAAKQNGFKEMLETIRSQYRPGVVVAASAFPAPKDAPALLANRPLKDGKVTTYVCEGFVCKQPVTSTAELLGQL